MVEEEYYNRKQKLSNSNYFTNCRVVLSKNQILDKVWGLDSDIDENSVEIYVSHLRKKLVCVNSGISIDTVRGVGYCLNEAILK